MLAAADQRPARITLFILVLFCFYLGVAASTTLWDRDEPRFARAAVEMWQTGDYLVPRFNGDLRPDKPPLVYWCMNPWIELLGPTDLAVRIPSILGSLVMAIATFHIGRNLGGPQLGKRALWLLLCMPLPIFIGTAATADGTLLAGVSVSLAVMVDRWTRGHSKFHFWILSLALTWALLAKGPVGLSAFWLGTIFIAIAGRSHMKWDRRWWWEATAATSVALLCFLAWGLPANDQTGGELARLGLGRHVFQRILEPLESHGVSGLLGWLTSLPFYIPVLLAGAAPASALLIPGILRRRNFSAEQRRVALILTSLILPVFLLMTLIATKLPHYILSSFPGVAVAGAWIWSMTGVGDDSGMGSRSSRVGRGLTLLMLLTLAVAWIFAVHQVSGSVVVAIPSVALFLMSCWSLLNWNPEASFFSAKAPGGTAALVALAVGSLLMGAGTLEPHCKVAQPIRDLVQSSGEPYSTARLSTAGYFEPSLVFALNPDAVTGERGVPQLLADEGKIWIGEKGPAWLVTGVEVGKESPLEPLLVSSARIERRWHQRIFNYSNGRWLDIALWLRLP